MIDCQNCQNINNMSKECKLNKPQYFDTDTKKVRPKGDCRHYLEKVFQE
jgi:hypothetical protein